MSSDVQNRIDFPKLLEQIGFTGVDPEAKDYHGYCLFHEDVNTKSFSANLEKGLFYCFGCGIRGNGVTLYALWKRIDYAKAKEELKDLPVIRSIEKLQSQLQATATKVPTHKRIQMLTEFVSILPMVTATPFKDYLHARGLSDKTLDDHGIRGLHLNAALAAELTKFSDRYSVDELEAVGLATNRYGGYHRLQFVNHPIIFPYFLGSSVVWLQGRMATPGSKDDLRYMSASTAITHAFNHDAFQTTTETLYVCEGAMDALSMAELGYRPAVGVPGVNNFKESWLDNLHCNKVVLAFDNDTAGLSAYGRIALMLTKRNRTPWRFTLPAGVKDVNDFLLLYRR